MNRSDWVLMTARLTFQDFADPRMTMYEVKRHKNTVEDFAYLFPGRPQDLRPGEFWAGVSLHASGSLGVQNYGHDLSVEGFVEALGEYSTTFSGRRGTKVEDFRAWGTPVHAMADGRVESRLDGIVDHPVPGVFPDSYPSPEHAGGNQFVIEHGGEMVLYAHLQQGSLNPSLVKDADVSAGDFLGLVGSSGRSTEPHLHIHAAFGSVIYGPMRPILFREAQFLGKHHAIMPIGESPWIDANGKEIPAMRSLIWPSSEARTGWPRDWPKDTDERERGPDRPWEWPIRVVRSVVRFFSRLFQSMFGSGR